MSEDGTVTATTESKANLLLVDDDAALRRVFTHMLNKSGVTAVDRAPRIERKRNTMVKTIAAALMVAVGVTSLSAEELSSPAAPAPASRADTLSLSLQECLDIARERNHQRPASQLGIEISEAQHRQALSSYWPQVTLSSALARRDQDPIFIFPEETETYGFKLGDSEMAAEVNVPDKHVVLQDKTHFVATGELMFPLYTGGLRPAVVRQARAGVAAARQQARRTDLQVIYDVKRMYHGCVLAATLVDIGEEALARLEVTLELTENLYKRGSGKVKKTDYLAHKVVVEGLRSMVAGLHSNRELAHSALANTMGLPWQARVEPTADEVPYTAFDLDLGSLVNGTYRFNPDWARLHAGLEALDAKVAEARSGRLPKLALFGNLQVIGNSHDKGTVGPDEEKSWLVGVGMQVPVFDGFLTKGRIREAKARLEQLKHQKILLREGLALQTKAVFLALMRAQSQEAASGDALSAASDNRRLNARAYQDQLVEVQDVIQS